VLGSTADVPGSTSDVLSSVLESTSGGKDGLFYGIFVEWENSSFPKPRNDCLRSNCFVPSL
jgi:hypothetical protein